MYSHDSHTLIIIIINNPECYKLELCRKGMRACVCSPIRPAYKCACISTVHILRMYTDSWKHLETLFDKQIKLFIDSIMCVCVCASHALRPIHTRRIRRVHTALWSLGLHTLLCSWRVHVVVLIRKFEFTCLVFVRRFVVTIFGKYMHVPWRM